MAKGKSHNVGGGDRLDVGLAFSGLTAGLVSGFALAHSELYLPKSIQSALAFESESIYALLLAYMTTSLMVNMVIWLIDRDNRYNLGNTGLVQQSLGSLLLGFGMYVSGSDLLALFVQLGAATESSLWTALGAMASALALFAVMDHIKDSSRLDEPYLDRMISRKRNTYIFVAGGLLALFAILCGVINIDGVTKGPRPKVDDFIPDPRKENWSPYTVGFVTALGAVPLRFWYHKRLQGYCGFINMICFPVAQLSGKTNCMKDSAYVRYLGSVEALWCFILGLGVALGGLMSAASNGSLSHIQSDKNWICSICGGAIMMAGAILSGGDLFAHMAGSVDLHLPSMINLACLAIGGFIGAPVVNLFK